MEHYVLEVLNRLTLMVPAFITGIFVRKWIERRK